MLSGGADAFDALSPRYDSLFSPTANPLVGMMRARVHALCSRYFTSGATLLELGCGTGEDTLALAQMGYRLLSCDPAPGMLERAKDKLSRAGLSDRATFVAMGAAELGSRWGELGHTKVDGVFSNFAPLNCELSLDPIHTLLERSLLSKGRFIAVPLPRFCPLEIILFALRGDVRTAVRRFSRCPVGDVEGRRFPMRYYGVSDFDRALGDDFQRLELRSLGLALPPLSLGPRFASVPGLLAALGGIEDRLSGVPGLRRMGDHIAIVYERRR